MEKIVVLSCTNRENSNTLKVSKIYLNLLNQLGAEAHLFDFRDLPRDLAFSESFGNRSAGYDAMLNEQVRPFQKFVLVVPEYNGSFPGILKSFLDSLHPRDWNNKKVCLVGVADGRAGNLRGMEHLTGILHYLKMHVYYNKLPISVVNKLLNENFEFNSEDQIKVCKAQLEGFLGF